MGSSMTGYWNIYGCINKEKHSVNVAFSMPIGCDQADKPCCPVCRESENVKLIETDFLDR